jgi:hypothetical protein
MMKWFLGSVVAAACAAVIAAGPAAAGTFGCQKTIGGHAWLITGHGLTCRGAAAIVKRLSSVTVHAPGTFAGTYAGMQCASTSIGQKPKFIGCSDGKGKNIYAIRKS